MLKLDGLTVKLVYEDGNLVEGSTRGDGDEGKLITHNIAAFRNAPLSIPFKGHLELSGEGFIHKSDFERLKDTLGGSDGKPYPAGATAEEIEKQIQNLQELAEISDIPIDGMVLRYDSLSYSTSLGRTGHHYNDGIAFKSGYPPRDIPYPAAGTSAPSISSVCYPPPPSGMP